MLNKITKKLFLIVACLIIICNFCKAQPTGYSSYQGEGLNGGDIHRLSYFFSNEEMILVTDSGRVYYSYDYGLHWTLPIGGAYQKFHNLNEKHATGGQFPVLNKFNKQNKDGVLTSSTDSSWAVGDSGVISFTSNGGANWIQQVSGITGDIFTIDFPDSHNGWAADIQNHLIHTTNAGNNWVLQSNDIGFSIGTMYFNDPLNGWASGYYSGSSSIIKYTSNGGSNWVVRTPSGNFDTYAYFSRIQFINQNTGWACGTNYNHYSLFRTTNGGVHWDSCTVNPAPSILSGLCFVNPSTGYVCGDELIFKTTNGGVNWISQTLPPGTPILYDIQFANPDTGFAVGQLATILYTTSGGQPIGIKSISSEIPKDFSLSQNYPNPFNPTTKIRFSVPMSGKGLQPLVQIKVYDVTGREIAILVNEQLQPGTYEADWEASNEPSGVYFYKLVIGDNTNNRGFTETKKMILVK